MKSEMWIKGMTPDGEEVIMKIDGEMAAKIADSFMPPAVSIMDDNSSVSLVDKELFERDILPIKPPRIVEFDNE